MLRFIRKGLAVNAACAVAALMMAAPSGADDPDIVFQPLRFGGVQEISGITKGIVANDAAVWNSTDEKLQLRNEWVDHFGTFLEQDATVNGRLELRVGLGGVFQMPKPERPIPKFGSSMYKLFFFGPSVAKATYAFGNPEKPLLSLGGGLFPFKYNPDAADLGEYLFRSTPYPATLFTGGLTFISDNSAYLQGFHGQASLGGFDLNVLLTTETSLPPLYDWSLGLVGAYRALDGALELGAGFNLKRLIPVNSKRTRLKNIANASFEKGGVTYYGSHVFYSQQMDFYNQLADTLGARGNPVDSAATRARAVAFKDHADSLNLWLADPSLVDSIIPEASRKYYTPAGLLLMARISLDVGKLAGMDPGRFPFKLFAEAALLGWEDYPVFYEKKQERMPLMAGAHLPAFGVLDQLTVQFEYFNSRWANNTYNLGAQNMALPYMPSGAEPMFSKEEYNDVTKHDNYAWAVLLRRRLYGSLSLSAQFARDHMRTIGTNWFYGGRLEPIEVLWRNSAWYWTVQLGWAL